MGVGIATGGGGGAAGRMEAFLPVTPVLPGGKLVLDMLPLFVGLVFKKLVCEFDMFSERCYFPLGSGLSWSPASEPMSVTTHRQSHPRTPPPPAQQALW